MDACSLILLAKASVLESAAEEYSIIVTSEVYQEVVAGKQQMFPDALLVERLHNEEKIAIEKIEGKMTRKLIQDFNMGAGESSTLALGLKNQKMIVATDNKQGRKAATIFNLLLVGSIEVIVSLFKRKKISQEKAITALKILQKEGWFNSYLIEKGIEDIA